MSNIIHLNESELKNQLGDLVRGTVEETLNKLLDAEANRIVNAGRYERSLEPSANSIKKCTFTLIIGEIDPCRQNIPMYIMYIWMEST